MKISFLYLVVFLLLIYSDAVSQNWPKEIKAKSGALIMIYQPQTESMKGDKISGRAAFSAQEKPTDELLFGVFWYTATMITNRDERTATLESIVVKEIKLPGIDDTTKINKLRTLLETEIPKWEITSSLDEIISEIWSIAATYARSNNITTRTSELIPALNAMIDITTTRRAAGESTIPDPIMYFLFALCLCSAFLLGYDHKNKFDRIVVFGFAFMLSVTVFMIIDLDRPRSGLINMDKPNEKIVELREMFIEK